MSEQGQSGWIRASKKKGSLSEAVCGFNPLASASSIQEVLNAQDQPAWVRRSKKSRGRRGGGSGAGKG